MFRLVSVREEKLITDYEPDLQKLKFLYGLYAFFVFASIIMPQYFGLHVGYDITCARFSNVLFVIYMVVSPFIMMHFIQTVARCEIFYPLCLYLFVSVYTMVYRVDVNAFFLVFLEIFSMFMMIYGIRYVVGYRRAIKWVLGCVYFLTCYGIVEFLYGKSIFLQFFKTMPTLVHNSYRSGHYRIMGPCGHSLGYGLVLLLFLAIACVDFEKNELYLFRRPVLLVLILVNVFFTGSRSTLGISVLEILIILLFSNRNNKKKSIFWLGVAGMGLAFFVLLFQGTGMGRYLLGQIASVIDQFFDTNFALKYGIDTETLKNSEEYRDVLPLIFKLDWLNPIVGRGRGFSGAEINGKFIHSIDNYYVLQYIKYAYPGMISYILFMVVLIVVLIKDLLKRNNTHSAVTKFVLIASLMYFFNIWWVDVLQTLKYLYIVIAIFYAAYLEEKDLKERKENDSVRKVEKTRNEKFI